MFQDPYASLNPHRTARQIVYEGLEIQRTGLTRRQLRSAAASLLERVGVNPEYADRYPHEFSGGERQRIGIARALALEPKLLICDEPVSSLDVSVQAQLLNLFRELRSEQGLAYLFISHDLGVVQHVADTVAVMYLGKVVESGRLQDVFAHPRHPYSVALSSAMPKLRPWQGAPRGKGSYARRATFAASSPVRLSLQDALLEGDRAVRDRRARAQVPRRRPTGRLPLPRASLDGDRVTSLETEAHSYDRRTNGRLR